MGRFSRSVVVVVFLMAGVGRSYETKTLELGATAKKELQDLAKKQVSVEAIDAAGVKELVKNDTKKLRLINVWATWCGPCKYEFPELVKIYWIYRNRRTTEFELITISTDPPKAGDAVLSSLKEYQASCKNYHYDSENIYELIEALNKDWQGGIPYTLLVAPGGNIIYRMMGTGPGAPLEVKRAIVGYYAEVLPWWVSEE